MHSGIKLYIYIWISYEEKEKTVCEWIKCLYSRSIYSTYQLPSTVRRTVQWIRHNKIEHGRKKNRYRWKISRYTYLKDVCLQEQWTCLQTVALGQLYQTMDSSAASSKPCLSSFVFPTRFWSYHHMVVHSQQDFDLTTIWQILTDGMYGDLSLIPEFRCV